MTGGKKKRNHKMSMQEFFTAILNQDDISGTTLIMPGQPVIHIAKEGVQMSGRKLYVVDYKENGQDKHQVIEGECVGCLTDKEVVQMLHFYIGKCNRLTMVAEFTTDLSLDQFNQVCDMPIIFMIPHRVLYVDMEEAAEVKELMNK